MVMYGGRGDTLVFRFCGTMTPTVCVGERERESFFWNEQNPEESKVRIRSIVVCAAAAPHINET